MRHLILRSKLKSTFTSNHIFTVEYFYNDLELLSEIWYTESGDTVDVLVPFLSGVGEATDAMRIADKAEYIVDAIDDVYDSARAAGNGFDAAGTANNTIDTYKTLKKANKGKGLEIHHIVEKRFAKDLDIKNTGDMLSIALTKSEHRIYTNAWRKQIGYNTGRHSPQQIWEAAQRVYVDRPDLLKAARKTIFGG